MTSSAPKAEAAISKGSLSEARPAVMAKTLMGLVPRRISLMTSRPSLPGMTRSVTRTSIVAAAMVANASSPLVANKISWPLSLNAAAAISR